MEQNYLTRAAKYLADLRKRKAWKKVVSALGTAVVFCTVYALILPAITLTRPLTCTVEVHHHNESCYAAVEPSTIAAGVNLPRQICGVESIYADVALGVDRADFVLHTHNESCWQDGQLVCTLPERHVHQHTAACYQTVKELTCGHPEVGTDTVPTNPDTQQPPVTVEPEPVPIHKHTEQCYTNALVCELEETPATAGHTHDESCYTTETIPSELICTITAETDPEHIHDANCYGPEQTNQVLACGQEESLPTEGHTHTDACWQMELTCGMQEGQPELTSIPDEPVPTSENDFDTVTIADEVPVTVSQDGVETNMDGQQAPAGVHVHTDACYVEREILNCPDVIDTPHEHDDTCRDVNGNYICGRAVTREHIHTAECFVIDAPDENLPEPERTPICGKVEHEHGNECYAPIEEPTVDRTEQDQKWGALFWSNIVGESSETISGQISANWMDTQNMDILALEALRNAEPQDMARYMDVNLTGIWIGDQNIPQGGHLYNVTNDGPMAPDAPFTVQLNWNLDASHFATETTTTTVPTETTTVPQEQQRNFTQQDMEGYSGDMAIAPIAYAAEQVVPETTTTAPMTTTTVTASGTLSYYYRLPDGIVVENVEKRVLYNEGTDNPALSYSVMDNVLNVTYYAPAESVNTTFTLKANWAEGVTENETVTLNWSNSTFSTVQFASPKLELTKSMGENGLRVEEDGTVWADYTVTVKNDSPVTAKDITLSDTLEAELFHFYRGGFAEGSADYTVTSLTPAATGEDGSEMTGETTTTTNETFPAEFDGGNTLVFPTFELAPGETKTFAYMAQMSAEDRETTDAAILAEAETLPQGQRPSGVTVSNTATLSCPGSKETPELTAKAQATYGGPDSKHIEDVTAEYHGDTFDATFTVNGDAILPPGISAERVEEIGKGGFLMKVIALDESSEEYQSFAQHLGSNTEEGEEDTDEQLELSVLGLELRYNSMKLDLSGCDVTVEIKPNETLKNYHKPQVASEKKEEVLGDQGYSVSLKAFTLSNEPVTDAITGETTTVGTPVEEGEVSFDIITKAAETATTVETVEEVQTVAPMARMAMAPMMATASVEEPAETTTDTSNVQSGDNGIIMLSMDGDGYVATQSELGDLPEYTVNIFGKVKLLELKESGDLAVIDTRKLEGYLPSNGLGNEDKSVAYLTLEPSKNDTTGREKEKVGSTSVVHTEDKLVRLFKGKTIQVRLNEEGQVDLKTLLILAQFKQFADIGVEDKDGLTNYRVESYAIIPPAQNKKQVDYTSKLEELKKELQAAEENKDSTKVTKLKQDISEYEGLLATVEKKIEEIPTVSVSGDSDLSKIYVKMDDGSGIKLNCVATETDKGAYSATANFYDYDISDGYVYADSNTKPETPKALSGTADADAYSVKWAYVKKQGINSDDNYPDKDKTEKGLHFAFGNNNMPTGLGQVKNGDLFINKGNDSGKIVNFKKCAFGLVQNKLSDNGKLQYAKGILAPQLFDESETVTGKTVYKGDYKLIFDRQGDTYTMKQVQNKAGDPVTGNLTEFKNTGTAWNSTISMYSNLFWPMDGAGSHGTNDDGKGHDYKFGSHSGIGKQKAFGANNSNPSQADTAGVPTTDEAGLVNSTTTSAQLTEWGMDPEANHNAYFGMQFECEFFIPEGYVGPLEYCFFGDDDLWLFLDGKLVCDIGGVHQAAGEYVDLRKHLPVGGDGVEGKHSLKLFYTERGASGSTCWMQLTLPGLKFKPVDVGPGNETAQLRVEKLVEGSVGKDIPFKFGLSLNQEGTYNCTYYDANGFELTDADETAYPKTITITPSGLGQYSTAEFTLKANESVLIKGLPKGTNYRISELPDENGNIYTATVKQSVAGAPAVDVSIDQSEKECGGKLNANTTDTVTFTNTFHYTLPETGGLGTSNRIWYTYGALPVMAAAVVVYKRSRKKGGNVS